MKKSKTAKPKATKLKSEAIPTDIPASCRRILSNGKKEIVNNMLENKEPAEIDDQTRSLTNYLLSEMSKELAAQEVARNRGVDNNDYVDFLDKVYLDKAMSSSIEASASNESRRKIAVQRRKMKNWALKDKKEITPEKWEKEGEKLGDLFLDYFRILFYQQLHQSKILEIINSRFRERNAPNSKDVLLPKELVARQLLFDELPTKNALVFISENFNREEFRDFARKIRALRNKNRVLTAPNITIEHRKVSKRELLNDIALRVKQYSKTFEALLIPDPNPWPREILPMSYSPEEMELIISICYGLSPRFDRTFENTLKIFSYSELENLSYKVDYRIDAIVTDQACRNILYVKLILYREKVSSDSKLLQSTKKLCQELLDQERSQKDELVTSITQKILKPRIRELTMFLLLPDISDKLTCEEKLFIISCIKFQNIPGRCPDSLEFLQRFAKKLTNFERKLEIDLNELLIDRRASSDNLICPPGNDWCAWDTDVHSARNSKKSRKPRVSPVQDSEFFLFEKGQIENEFLVGLIYKILCHNNFDFSNANQRIQFNKDFRTVFSNRHFMLQTEEKEVDCPEKFAHFYDKCIKDFDLDETDFVPYEQIVLQLVGHNMGVEEPTPTETLPEPATPRIRRKINENDPIRVARRKWKSIVHLTAPNNYHVISCKNDTSCDVN